MRDGDEAPDFTLLDQDGQSVTLSALLANGPVVLFFYPAAMTKGCTKETCHFRDLASEFAKLGAQRVGISMDEVDRQHEFAEHNKLDYPLLSDSDGAVAKLFGVKRPIGLLKVRRSTFVINQQRHIIKVINSEIDMNAHADRALEALGSM